jgi:hypothetical protein
MVARLRALLRPRWLDRLISYRGDFTLIHRISFWAVACALGFLRAWNARRGVAWDGVSYLDVGDMFLSRGWYAGVNACWNPLYAWLVALPGHLFGVPRQWESRALHLVNFGIWLGVIAAFECLVGTVIARSPRSTEDDRSGLAPWALRLLFYCLFLHAAVAWLNAEVDTPDLLVEGVLYGLMAVVGRMRVRSRAIDALILGGLAGIGYLAKMIMFPVAFVFFLTALFMKPRPGVSRIALALGSFLLISVPVAATVSIKVGHASIGEAGRLNYLWYVNGVDKWPPHLGIDEKHTVRQLLRDPVVLEFPDEPGESVPLWYAPYEWHGGQQVHFEARQQLRALWTNGRRELRLALGSPEFVALLLVVWLLRSRSQSVRRGLALQADLLAPSLAVLFLYALVSVQARYLAGALVALWIGAVAGVAVKADARSRTIVVCLTLVVAMISSARVALAVRKDPGYITRIHGNGVNDDWLVAERLRELGIRPGDRVATAGRFLDAYWPRLAGVQVVANVSDDHAGNRWTGDAELARTVIDAVRRAHARVIVARVSSADSYSADWQPISGAPFVVRVL